MYPNDFIPPPSESVVLSALKFKLRQDLGDLEFVASSVGVEMVRGVFDRMTAEIRTEVLAEKLPPHKIERDVPVYFKQPVSWWDHFKLDHERSRWIGWLIRRLNPPRIHRETKLVSMVVWLDRFWAYPEAKVPASDLLGRPRRHYTVDVRTNVRRPNDPA